MLILSGPAITANWMLWPFVQLILQGVVPLELRMIFAALVNVPWTAFLAWKAGKASATPLIETEMSLRG